MNELNISVIKCDYDGKIFYFDKKSEVLFSYFSEDIIGKKRVYNLLHADSIFDFVKTLDFLLNKSLSYLEREFVLLDSKNSKFFVLMRIELDENKNFILKIKKNSDYRIVEKKFINIDKINLIFRSKFVVGSIIPFLFSVVWSFYRFEKVDLFLVFLIFISVIFLHIAANILNDYFDWISGRDKKNLDYVLFSTGGSRAIDFKLISENNLFYLSIFFLFIVFLIGLYFVYIKGIIILLIGFVAFFSIYFYSAPPIHLASRYGLGELMHIFCLGPLITYGSAIILSSNFHDVGFIDFFIGFPFGLLITGCLLMNEYPDSKFDKLSGKFNLAVVLGVKYIPYLYLLFLLLSYTMVLLSIFIFKASFYYFFVFLLFPYSFFTLKCVFNIGSNRKFVVNSCIRSFNVYFYFSSILILSSLLQVIYPW